MSAKRMTGAIGALMLLAGGANAEPSPWAAAQLKGLDSGGFDRAAEVLTFEGAASQGQESTVRIDIDRPGLWALVGSCGQDCEEIGLIMDRAGGGQVAEGVTGFSTALTPGAYDLHVGFDNCHQPTCRFVVRAYRKP